jgi:energy-coupling factor transporter ATP-binding protein EcfA2
MNINNRKKYYNLCNPYKLQGSDSGHILDIDNYKIGDNKVNARGAVWAEEIADKIFWSDEPEVVYFTGYTGSGKTTELQRVMKNLGDENGANLLPVYINSVDFFDKHSKLELIDILSIIVYNVTDSVAKYMNDKSLSLDNSSYFSDLWRWLVDTDVQLKGVELEASPAKLIFEMKNRPDFRKRVKASVNTDITDFKRKALLELQRLNEKVKKYVKDKKRKSGILVVLDSLEHNRGIGDNIDIVAESAERLFKDKDNLKLPVDVIYTIPSYLSTRHIGDIFFLPVVRVYERESKNPYTPAVTLMKDFIYNRIQKKELLTFMSEKELESVILFSGGYPRDLLKMMQKLLMSKSDKLESQHIKTIFLNLQNEYKEFIPAEFKEKLKTISKTNELDLNEHDQRDLAYELFSIHAILRYKNGNLWWDLHPALKKVLSIDG